jgi:hypothetical protein
MNQSKQDEMGRDVICMEMRNALKFRSGNLKGSDHLGETGTEGRNSEKLDTEYTQVDYDGVQRQA